MLLVYTSNIAVFLVSMFINHFCVGVGSQCSPHSGNKVRIPARALFLEM